MLMLSEEELLWCFIMADKAIDKGLTYPLVQQIKKYEYLERMSILYYYVYIMEE